jgi:heat shock protein HslJ
MRRSLLVAVTLLLATATACGDARPGEATSHEAAASLQGHTYGSTRVLVDGAVKPLEAGTRVVLAFDREGRLTGSAGCNHFSGNVSADDGRIRQAKEIMITAMACSPSLGAQETWLLETLRAAPRWELVGSTLTLSTPDTQIVLTDLPLTGKRWVVTELISGNVTTPTPSEAEAFMTIHADGTVDGFTGCSAFTGNARIAGNQVTFDAIQTQGGICPGVEADLDQAVLRTLAGQMTYELHGEHRTLVNAAGYGLMLTAANDGPTPTSTAR